MNTGIAVSPPSETLPKYEVKQPIDERFLAPRRPRLRVLSVCSVALSINVLAGVLLLVPEQSHEALRVLAEDQGWGTLRLFLMWVAATALAMLSWWACRGTLISLHPPARRPEWGAPRLAEWLPRFIGGMPYLMLGLAIFRTEAGDGGWERLLAVLTLTPIVIWVALAKWKSDWSRDQGHFLAFASAGLILVALLSVRQWSRDQTALTPMLGLCLFSFPAFLIATHRRTALRPGGATDPPLGRRAIVLAVVLPVMVSVVLLAVLSIWPDLAASVGPGTIVLTAAAIWLPLLSVFHWCSLRYRRPILVIFLLTGVAASALDTNDNHRVRSLPAGAGAPVPAFEETFRAWLLDRAEQVPAGEPVPVFLVAAEGGGIYAAYHTARALSLLQDENELFSRHIFAISGVSGGSVGAAVFCSLVEHAQGRWPQSPAPKGWYAEAADRVLARDFLSPLTGGALLEDMFQRVFPIAIPAFDRARVLERSFERAWRSGVLAEGDEPEVAVRDCFAEPFDRLWPAGSPAPRVPSLLLNTTEAETGRRVVITNLGLTRDLFPYLKTLRQLDPELNPPLSTAACLSARFPIVTPAAWLRLSDEVLRQEATDLGLAGPDGEIPRGKLGPSKRRLVDGGYFDNTGLATLLDVRDAIEQIHSDDHELPPIRLVLIRIGAEDGRAGHPFQGMGESLSPIRAMLNTRGARGQDAIRRLQRMTVWLNTKQHESLEPRPERLEMVLDTHRNHPVPLGWLLSKKARREIVAQLPTPDRIALTPPPPELWLAFAQPLPAPPPTATTEQVSPLQINAEAAKGVEQLLRTVRPQGTK